MNKKALHIIIICFLAISPRLFGQPVKDHGRLHVEGVKLLDEKNNPVVLRGMSYGWHNRCYRFCTPQVVDWLVDDWKCTVIRSAMGIEMDSMCYIRNPAWSSKIVTTVVDECIRKGIYVIIDWHSHHINLRESKTFFTEMAQKYKDYPNVIYEIFNEPAYNNWPEVKAYSIEVISSIRAIDPDNIIIVGSPHWDQDVNIAADDPVKGFKNIMYSLHYYAGTHKQELRDKAEYALEKGLPLFISECGGMNANGNGDLDYKEWTTWINWAEQRQISWVVWSVHDKHETCSVLLKSASSSGNWNESDLNESGVACRKLLRKYNTAE